MTSTIRKENTARMCMENSTDGYFQIMQPRVMSILFKLLIFF